MSARSERIGSWDALCEAVAQRKLSPNLSNTSAGYVTDFMDRYKTYILDNNNGICSDVLPVATSDTFTTKNDVRKQRLNRSYLIALLPGSMCEHIRRTIKNLTVRVYDQEGQKTTAGTFKDYIDLSSIQVEDRDGKKRLLLDEVIEPSDIQGAFLASYVQDILGRPEINATALRADMKRRDLQWLVLYGTPCDDRILFDELWYLLEARAANEETTNPKPKPKEKALPTLEPEAEVIQSYKNLKRYSVKSFQMVRKNEKPSPNALGDMLVKQPQNDTQYRVLYTISGREALIEAAYEKDLQQTTQKIFGVMYDAQNAKFIGLVERTV